MPPSQKSLDALISCVTNGLGNALIQPLLLRQRPGTQSAPQATGPELALRVGAEAVPPTLAPVPPANPRSRAGLPMQVSHHWIGPGPGGFGPVEKSPGKSLSVWGNGLLTIVAGDRIFRLHLLQVFPGQCATGFRWPARTPLEAVDAEVHVAGSMDACGQIARQLR